MTALLNLFSSLKLTVILLTLSLVLIFFGTLDQVEFGIWETQKRYFESFFVVWSYPEHATAGSYLQWLKLPLPGGYLLGGLLLINLCAAHATRFQLTWKKSGLFCIHLGLILLLVSELLTDILSEESQMSIDEGASSHYSETVLENELVLINRSHPEYDQVHAIPSSLFKKPRIISIPGTSLSLRALKYFPNAKIARAEESLPLNTQFANRGIVERIPLQVLPAPMDYSTDAINTATAYVEVFETKNGPDSEPKSLGVWLLSNVIDERFPPQIVYSDSQPYELALRFKRSYHPFSVELIDFTHEKYPGTDIPYNFSSEVVLKDLAGNEQQKALIYMNHPLRYGGLTFYQASFANEDRTSIFQVVQNPGWLLPYISVLLMGFGMCFQFGMHFFKFSRKAHHS
ncbi:MAG: ResB protein required for cytochrome C biosynthesis [Puniceicoccaceae bacterium]|nr:ResB protein required for cytochrome C biosynthesis [Puniceicoccaceae bacterium]